MPKPRFVVVKHFKGETIYTQSQFTGYFPITLVAENEYFVLESVKKTRVHILTREQKDAFVASFMPKLSLISDFQSQLSSLEDKLTSLASHTDLVEGFKDVIELNKRVI